MKPAATKKDTTTTPAAGAPPRLQHLLDFSQHGLETVDPVVLNLVVAQEIPLFSSLDIGLYSCEVNRWATELRGCLPGAEQEFHRTPEAWKDDLAFFHLGMLCWYVDEVLGIRYREDQRDLQTVCYTDPRDLLPRHE
jgi:hypothetical protein